MKIYGLTQAEIQNIVVPMYVETVPNRNSPPAVLLRERRAAHLIETFPVPGTSES